MAAGTAPGPPAEPYTFRTHVRLHHTPLAGIAGRLVFSTLPRIEEREFESLLDQVRELHRRADEITRSKARLDENIRARLRWEDSLAPTLPDEQRKLADEVVKALTGRRLTSRQSRRLHATYFGR